MRHSSFCLVSNIKVITAYNNYIEVGKLIEKTDQVVRNLVMAAYSERLVLGLFKRRERFFAVHGNASSYLPEEYYGDCWRYISGYEVSENTFIKLKAMCDVSDAVFLDKLDSLIVSTYYDYNTDVVIKDIKNKLHDSYVKLYNIGENDVAVSVLKALSEINKIGDL